MTITKPWLTCHLEFRCTYNTTGHHSATRIGPAGGDEMCNLYLMYYTVSKEVHCRDRDHIYHSFQDDFIVCGDEQNPGLTKLLPRF